MLYNLFNILLSIGFVTSMHVPNRSSGLGYALDGWTDEQLELAFELDPYSMPTPSWVKTLSQTNNLAESSQSSEMAFPNFGSRRELSQKLTVNVDELLQGCRTGRDTGFKRILGVEYRDLFSNKRLDGLNVYVYSKTLGNGEIARLVRVAHANGGTAMDAGALKNPLHRVFDIFYFKMDEHLSQLLLSPDERSEKLSGAVNWLWNTLTKQGAKGSIPVIGFINSETDHGNVFKLARYEASLIKLISEYKVTSTEEWEEETSKFVHQLAFSYAMAHLPKPLSR